MLDVRLARLSLPLPLEPAIRRALTQRDRAAQHEGLVLAWELATRILAGSMWATCRSIGASSPALERVAAKLDRPSLGHWVELARACATLLNRHPASAAIAFRGTLDGLDQPLPAECGLRTLASRIAKLPDAPPRPRRVQEVLDQIPFYRNSAQSTHRDLGPTFREESVQALLEGLIDFCERVPLCGAFSFVFVGRLERTDRGGSAEFARLSGANLSWSVRDLPESTWGRLFSSRPYLFQEPDLIVPLFPMAAVSTSGSDWHVGWYARQVRVPTVAYQGAGGTEFQIALGPDEIASFSGEAQPEAGTALRAELLRLDPYRGLLAYDEEHAAIFFGREEETEAALARIEERGALFVYGASGSGKSSWLRAGIVPALRARAALMGRTLLPIVFVPGETPLTALRRALTLARGTTTKQSIVWSRVVNEAIPNALEDVKKQGLARVLRTLAAEGAIPTLVVDQLEEAAILPHNKAESRVFLALIAEAARTAKDIGAIILVSARADLLGPLLEFESVRMVLQSDGWPIGSIPPERLMRVVVEPLRGRKVPIDSGLAETILADVGAEPGALALLSQVLTTLWSERERFGGGLTKQGYLDAGRVAGALEKQAEAALAEARAASRGAEKRIDRLFRALAASDGGERFTRRRVTFAALESELGRSVEELRALAQPFVKRRLLVLAGDEGEETIEVAHERLLDAWPRLANLLATEREVLDLRSEIESAATAWELSDGKRELWSDSSSKLRRGEELLAADRIDLDDRGRAFLEASRESVRRRKRNERVALAVMGVLAVGAMISTVIAVRAYQIANDNERTATLAQEREQEIARVATRNENYLLAIQQLRDLETRADSLWPAWPQNLGLFKQWLSSAEDLDKGHAGNLANGIHPKPSSRDYEHYLDEMLSDASDHNRQPSQWMLGVDTEIVEMHKRYLESLVKSLRDFKDDEMGGLYSMGTSIEHGWGISKRKAIAERLNEETVAGEKAQQSWRRAIDAIKSSPKYHGLQLQPQMGLLPILGEDPASGLWEFTDLQTGEPAERGADGKLIRSETTGLVFVLIPSGNFTSSSLGDDTGLDERHTDFAIGGDHERTVAVQAYFLSKYEMTQGQWSRFTGKDPSEYGSSGYDPRFNLEHREWSSLHPVESIRWIECDLVLRRLGLEIPSEVQWEYAARGGTTTPWWTGTRVSSLQGAANLLDAEGARLAGLDSSNSETELHDGNGVHAEVGTYLPNGFGLHDVCGNVREWCRSMYSNGATEVGGQQDDTKPRPVRGGSWASPASKARLDYREEINPTFWFNTLGVRPAREIEASPPAVSRPVR